MRYWLHLFESKKNPNIPQEIKLFRAELYDYMDGIIQQNGFKHIILGDIFPNIQHLLGPSNK